LKAIAKVPLVKMLFYETLFSPCKDTIFGFPI